MIKRSLELRKDKEVLDKKESYFGKK